MYIWIFWIIIIFSYDKIAGCLTSRISEKKVNNNNVRTFHNNKILKWSSVKNESRPSPSLAKVDTVHLLDQWGVFKWTSQNEKYYLAWLKCGWQKHSLNYRP